MKQFLTTISSRKKLQKNLWHCGTIFILLLLSSSTSFAQERQIHGRVVDINHQPLPGVNVLNTDKKLAGTVTDVDGNFTIRATGQDSLVFSFVGYLTQTVPIGDKEQIDISLLENIEKISEVVVVGYGIQKRTSVTGSISSVKGREIAETPVANISNSLAGKVSGVSMRSNGGQPGKDNPNIYIRGIGTTGGTNPLIVVDGIIRDNINQIDPNNIESVTILKDAAAVAPYGMGGANGVILITTKNGKTGETNLSFSTYTGLQTPTVTPDMLNATDYMTLRNAAYYSTSPNGQNPPYTKEFIAGYSQQHAVDPDNFPDNVFYKDIVKKYVPMQKYNMQLTGGSEKIRYYAGLGYYSQKGMLDNVDYNRYNYNMKLESNVTKTTKITASLSGSIEGTNTTNRDAKDIIWAGVAFLPIQPLKYSNGFYASPPSPVFQIYSGYQKKDVNTFLSNISIEQELPFIKGLSLKGVFGFDPTVSTNKNWDNPAITYKYVNNVFIANPPDHATSLYEDYSKSVNYTYQGFINYHRSFGKHEITGLGVVEYRKNTYDFLNASRQNYNVIIDELSLGSSDKTNFDNGGASSNSNSLGYVYRVGYAFAGKYIFETSGRYDGNSIFAPGHQYGFFPSLSVGWRISEESFLKDKFKDIDNLKIRGSWGKSGNLPYYKDANGFPQLAINQYLGTESLYNSAYYFGSSYVQGSYQPHAGNPEITWEVSTKTNVGFELTMWKGLLNFEFDYFHENRNNMLIPSTVVVPSEFGLALPLVNAGKMSNNGVEMSIGSTYKFENGLQLGLTGNFSYARNKLVYTIEDSSTYNNPNRRRTGRPLGTPFGYHSLGFFSMADDKNGDGVIDSLDGYNIKQFNATLRPGDIKYQDVNGDGVIDSNDEKVIGNPTYPAITYGFTLNAAWKGFDLSLFFQGATIASINTQNFQTVPFRNSLSNASYEFYNNYWTPDRPNAKYPRVYTSASVNNTQGSDFWTISTGYLRLKNITIGYSLPATIAKLVGMKTCRAYVCGQNLLTFSKLKFMDPEEAVVPTEKTYFYPNQKVYTVGLDLTF